MTQKVIVLAGFENFAPIIYCQAGTIIKLHGEDAAGQTNEVMTNLYSGGPDITVAGCPLFGFSHALNMLKAGRRVAREGWNGKGMWLALYDVDYSTVGATGGHDAPRPLPWIGLKTADDGFVPWLASQTDLLALDWTEVAA